MTSFEMNGISDKVDCYVLGDHVRDDLLDVTTVFVDKVLRQ